MDFDKEKRTRELIARSCLALDELQYAKFLEMCDSDFNYKITSYSPEIRRNMLWLEKDKKGLSELLDLLPQQNMDPTPITRHAALLMLEEADDPAVVNATSSLQVYRTELDGGATTLFAIGKYADRIRLNGGNAKLLSREVKLDTRMLGTGYHIPF